MPRTRSIKPEFFDDEKLSTIPIEARLLFIGLWVYADDYGAVKGSPRWLGAKIFPYDAFPPEKITAWLTDLTRIRAIIPYSVNGEKFFWIRNFTRYQSINRPSENRNPAPPQEILDSVSTHDILTEPSVSPHETLSDYSMLKTETETETETETRESSESVGGLTATDPTPSTSNGKKLARKPKPAISPNEIAELWNQIADPVLSRVIVPLSDKRKRLFAKPIRDHPELPWWQNLIQTVNNTPFLLGVNDRGWRADLEFVVRNYERILEGKYNRAKRMEDVPKWKRELLQDS